MTIPASQTKPPRSFSLSAEQAIVIANRTAAARKEFRVRPGLRPIAIFDEIRRRHPEIGERISPAVYKGLPVMSVAFFVQKADAVVWREAIDAVLQRSEEAFPATTLGL